LNEVDVGDSSITDATNFSVLPSTMTSSDHLQT
jgi:hypothetical protein